jgi:hypothetical protein
MVHDESGKRGPYSIELDHITPIDRNASIRAVIAGQASCAGAAAMIGNLRFVCRMAHLFIHSSENLPINKQEFGARLVVLSSLGSPCNQGVDVDNAQDVHMSPDELAEVIGKFIKSFDRTPLPSEIFEHVNGLPRATTKAHVYEAMKRCGYEPRFAYQKARVAVAIAVLRGDSLLIKAIQRNGAGEYGIVRSEIVKALTVAGYPVPSNQQLREDIFVAYEAATGLKYPRVWSGNRAAFAKKKLSIWTKNTPAARSRVYRLCRQHGSCGIDIECLVQSVLATDPMAQGESANYAESAKESLVEIINEMRQRRMVDIDQSGKVRARLTGQDAAVYCGYTPMTLMKFHKTGIGPSCDYALFGSGRVLSFSFKELDEWLEDRAPRRRVRSPSELAGLSHVARCVDSGIFAATEATDGR